MAAERTHPAPTARARRAAQAAALASLAVLGAQAGPAAPLLLHVPSPDWRDQIIYFVVTDRFADGDKHNNNLGAGEFDPTNGSRYSGGDLRGLTARLDYIRGLGATALWITPPVANQWVDPWTNYTGYHGYWGEHFKKVDRHLGNLADYRGLSDQLHRRGMYLVQDIVLNHTGNFFAYRGGFDAGDPARWYTPNLQSRPVTAPSQWPFSRNDPRRAEDRRLGVYHWTPDVVDYNEPRQEQNFQMGGLDDLNTESPVTRRALRDSYGWWIRQVGVDAFRVDTAFYVPPETFDDFLRARDPRAPGILEVARQTGRRQFHVFGEGFGIDRPFEDQQAQKIERYITGPQGRPLMPGMLNFPLYGALGDVFARGRPTAELAHRMTRTMTLHARPHLMVNFVDNHDVDRFLSSGSTAALRQSLLALMTLPGIPVIYYGTEQGFTEQRASMFAAGYGSGGQDRFDTQAPLYRYIAQASALRRANPLFSRGLPTVLQSNAAGAGALAYRMDHEGQAALVVLNSADGEALLDNLQTGWPAGTVLRGMLSLQGPATNTVVGPGGRLTMKLPARAGAVWKAEPAQGTTATPTAAGLSLDPLLPTPYSSDFTVSGLGPAGSALQLVVDGDLAQSQAVQVGADGRWQALLDTSRLIDPQTPHRLVAWSPGTGAASEAQRFHVEPSWKLLADVEDPAGDDHGPQGRYVYPTDAGWGENRQMDLRRIRVWGAGGALRVALTLPRITRSWNPPNGFDHVAFTMFIELPGQAGGARLMPQQNGELPAGMRWHVRLRASGWSNALHAADGATASNEGTSITPAATISSDSATQTVTFTLPPAALGRLKSLSGARLYVTTWDYDGGYRELAPTPQSHAIGGGDPATGTRVMDDSTVIVLP